MQLPKLSRGTVVPHAKHRTHRDTSARQTGHLLRETMFREILRFSDLNNS